LRKLTNGKVWSLDDSHKAEISKEWREEEGGGEGEETMMKLHTLGIYGTITADT
jgi:hypothetical protein